MMHLRPMMNTNQVLKVEKSWSRSLQSQMCTIYLLNDLTDFGILFQGCIDQVAEFLQSNLTANSYIGVRYCGILRIIIAQEVL